VVGPLLQGKMFGSYVIGQMLVLSGLPLLLLGYVVLFDVPNRRFLKVANFAALCIVFQVLLMRFNVVIGGQMISKSDRGYVDFHFEWLAREGVIPALIILAAPFVTYWVVSRFLPIFSDDALSSSGNGRH
jgi:predicted membrane protein